ncbi:MAG: GNAT family N-acetyltransferase [Candidatus Nanohaloarchaeota archaeon QJJ-5]|nr:GNAT family N-acetyltransferase [Candidatus Nanohaloarchaeota archaeon QJJ-5]
MRHEDVETVHRLGVDAEPFHTSEQEAEHSPFRPKDCLHDWVDSDDILLVDEHDDELRGFVLTSRHEPTGQLTINNIYVKEQYRREGIASALLEECLHQADAHGVRYVVAHTKPDNEPTQALLDTHGFRRGEAFLWMEQFRDKDA